MYTLCVFVGVLAAAHASVIGLGGVPAAILAGPAGTVTTAGVIGPAGIAAPGLVAPLGLGVTSQAAAQLALQLSVPAGSGLEGQWIPDVNEKLYDDGSYRPLIHGL